MQQVKIGFIPSHRESFGDDWAAQMRARCIEQFARVPGLKLVVPDESLTRRSAEEFAKKSKSLQAAFGGQESTFILNLAEAKVDGLGVVVPSLKDLLDKALSNVQE